MKQWIWFSEKIRLKRFVSFTKRRTSLVVISGASAHSVYSFQVKTVRAL